mmetsp:Transcript_60241/g.72428  ORF Transcript_60241/g.72428 Transcript_60241/m.72428 type:complete len:1312 (-) Transcript_60241:32-3967(-)
MWSLSVKTVGTPLDAASPSSNSSLSMEASSATSTIQPAAPQSIMSLKMDQKKPYKLNFDILIDPNDTLLNLHKLIQKETGLQPERQRLIYRGCLISVVSPGVKTTNAAISEPCSSNNTNEPLAFQDVRSISPSNSSSSSDSCGVEFTKKVSDVTGLGDGHTIHLVPRPLSVNSNETVSNNNNSSNQITTITSSTNNEERPLSPSADAAASLLVALLGLSSASSSSGNGLAGGHLNNDDEGESPELLTVARDAHRRRLFPLGSGRRHRMERTHTASTSAVSTTTRNNTDTAMQAASLSLEPIRQSLLTIHTMTDAAAAESAQEREAVVSSDSGRNTRHFFSGQWIDVLDTVNMWLEATVLEVVDTSVLGNATADENDSTNESISTDAATSNEGEGEAAASSRSRNDSRRGRANLGNDSHPVVFADELDRRSLLVNDEDSSADNISSVLQEVDEEETLTDQCNNHNENVVLLRIHYNGWDKRWDEWIRSDSNRIRMFRTRTYHEPSNNSHMLSSVATSSEDVFGGLDAGIMQCPVVQSDYMNTLSTAIATDTSDAAANGSGGGTSNILTAEEDRSSSLAQPQSSATVSWEGVNNERAAVLSELSNVWDTVHQAMIRVLPPSNTDSESQQRTSCSLPWSHGRSTATGSVDIAATGNVDRCRDLQALAPLLDRLGRALVDMAPHVSELAAETVSVSSPVPASSSLEQGSSVNSTDIERPSGLIEEPSTPESFLELCTRTDTNSRNNNSLNSSSQEEAPEADVSEATVESEPSAPPEASAEPATQDEQQNGQDDYIHGMINTYQSNPPRGLVRPARNRFALAAASLPNATSTISSNITRTIPARNGGIRLLSRRNVGLLSSDAAAAGSGSTTGSGTPSLVSMLANAFTSQNTAGTNIDGDTNQGGGAVGTTVMMIEADDDEVELFEDGSFPDFAQMLMMSGNGPNNSNTSVINGGTTTDLTDAATSVTSEAAEALVSSEDGTQQNNNDNDNDNTNTNHHNNVMDLQIHAIVGDGSGGTGPITFAIPTNAGIFGGFSSTTSGASSLSRRRRVANRREEEAAARTVQENMVDDLGLFGNLYGEPATPAVPIIMGEVVERSRRRPCNTATTASSQSTSQSVNSQSSVDDHDAFAMSLPSYLGALDSSGRSNRTNLTRSASVDYPTVVNAVGNSGGSSGAISSLRARAGVSNASYSSDEDDGTTLSNMINQSNGNSCNRRHGSSRSVGNNSMGRSNFRRGRSFSSNHSSSNSQRHTRAGLNSNRMGRVLRRVFSSSRVNRGSTNSSNNDSNTSSRTTSASHSHSWRRTNRDRNSEIGSNL